MKYRYIRKILSCLLLAVLLLPMICALAEVEEELQYSQLELFIDGAFPQPQAIMTIAADDFDIYVADQLRAQASEIYVRDYNLTKDALLTALSLMINDNPDLFYVSSQIGYYITNTGYITRIIPQYIYTGDDLQSRIDDFDATVDAIAAFASEANTTIGKLLRLNDYFCLHFAYDDSLTIYSPDQLFLTGTGVCQAYMLAYAAVLDELGIYNTHATSFSMSHTWNVVYLDGSWYHIDTTWNDSSVYSLFAGHNYFLLSDEGIASAGHYEWTSSVAALNTQYDAFFWRNIETPLGTAGDSVFYLSPGASGGRRSILRWDMDTGSTETIRSFDICNNNGSYMIYDGVDPITSDDESVFYASRGRLSAVSQDGEDTRLVYSTGDDSKHIWSCWMEDETIYMLVGDLSSSTSLVSCPADQRITLAVSDGAAFLNPGKILQLSASLSEDLADASVLSWASSDPSIVSVGEDGLVSALQTGIASVTARYADGAEDHCAIIVTEESGFTVPSGVTALDFEAFYGTSARKVILPDGLEAIGVRAFGECENLELVYIPDSVRYISALAFNGSENVTLLCMPGSYGEQYAISHDMHYVLLPLTE